MAKIAPCLWFSNQDAEEAAQFYVGVFGGNSKIDAVNAAPSDFPSGKRGDVLTVEFTLAGVQYLGLNGGKAPFAPTEAVSFQIFTDSQEETDRFYQLSARPESEQCGWIKDRYGFSWQIVPRRLLELMRQPDSAKSKRVMEAMMHMKRIDIAGLEKANEEP